MPQITTQGVPSPVGTSGQTAGAPAVPSTWAPLRSVGYRRLFISAMIVIFGTMGQAVARSWLARELTGSNAGLGGVLLTFGVCMLLATPWGGVAADRLPKRTVLLGATGALLVSSAGMGIAVVTDREAYWMLMVASGIQGAAFAMYLPSRISAIAELVEPSEIPSAVVLSQTSQEAMRVLAPALAGLLIGATWFGVGGLFLLAAGLCLVSLLLVARLPHQPIDPAARHERRSPLAEITDAVRYVRSSPGLSLIAVTTVGVVMIGFPYMTFLPTLADEEFGVGAGGYGVMFAATGLGAVGAGLASGRMHVMQRPWRSVAISGSLFSAGLIAFGLAPIFPLALVALALIGASGLVFQTTTQALLLALSDFEYHGRLQSLVVLGFSGFALMALPVGLLADAVTERITLIGMGLAVLGVITRFVLARRGRRSAAAIELA